MTVEDVLRERAKEVGIPAAELARRCDMSDVLLRRSFDGKRSIKSKELIRICQELNLALEDFASCIVKAS